MDFLNSAKQYIEQNMTLFRSPISAGLLRDGDDIAIRPTPSTPPTRYMEGSKTINFQFQILVQHASNRIAYDTCQSIEMYLDGLQKGAIASSDGSFTFNKCEVYTTTNFVEKTSKGHIYTAMFQAELLIEKEG